MDETGVSSPPDPERDAGSLRRFRLVGNSPAFLGALEQIVKIAACDATTLLQGETGTGKELAARAIHYEGPRRIKPFVPVNCGSLPDHLIANELFGHVRGAYTDARDEQRGLVGEARGGTLFLDEIETLSLPAQAALLRFLQDGTYRPLGGRQDVQANARVIAATNVELRSLVRSGQFRADLLYRLDVVNVVLPPLRVRGHDVILLAEHFLAHFSSQSGRTGPTLAAESVPRLLSYPWPGNVRELENVVHRAFVLAESGIADPARFLERASPGETETLEADSPPPSPALLDLGLARAKAAMIARFERSFVSLAMRECRGNVTAAARRCGKERRTFGKLLKKLGVDPRAYVAASSKMSVD